MATCSPDSLNENANAVGCRVVDFRAARRARALGRRSSSCGPTGGGPMSEVGAAISGMAVGPVGNNAPAPAKAYGAELAAQIQEKRSRLAAEREERQRAHQVDNGRMQPEGIEPCAQVHDEVSMQQQREANVCAREDSLSRFLAEQGGNAQQQPSSAPANMQRATAGRRTQSIAVQGTPWASGGPQENIVQTRKAREPAPWASHQDMPTPCRASGYQRGREAGGKPFATNGEQADALPPKASLPPRAPASMADIGNAPRPSVSNNVFAQGSNQNCGNVMTDRASSRVLAPPGGRSSVQLC